MNDARKRMVDDFGGDMSKRVEEVMQRQVDLAQSVFTGPEIVEMLLRVATGVTLSTILVVIQQKREDITAEALFDITADAIAQSVMARKPALDSVLAIVEGIRKTGVRP